MPVSSPRTAARLVVPSPYVAQVTLRCSSSSGTTTLSVMFALRPGTSVFEVGAGRAEGRAEGVGGDREAVRELVVERDVGLVVPPHRALTVEQAPRLGDGVAR